VVFYIISLAIVAYSWKRYFKDGDGDVAMLSVMAAAIFAAQMLNWPIPGGTSAHLVGGGLAAVILGPYGGCLAMFLNLVVQCLLMGDGGITALGANAFNMAVVAVFAGYWIYKAALSVLGEDKRALAAFLDGWIGITLAATACGVEIGLSPQFGYPLSVTVPVMAVWHFALGIIEGIVTGAVVWFLARKTPNVLYLER